MTDSGEKQIRPDLSFLLFFAACFIYCRLSLSILVFVWTSSLLFPPVCTSRSFLISLCLFKLHLRLLMYLYTTCGSCVLSHHEAARRSLGGPIPTSDDVWISTLKSLWSPMPYPAGMIHALAIVTSGEVYIPSIRSWPQK
jgi:hypothetical protein